MKHSPLFQVILVLGIALQAMFAFGQPPSSVFRPPSRPGAKIDFQVQENSFAVTDSITHLYLDPVAESVVRVFSTPTPIVGKKDAAAEMVTQRGILMENKTRITFPAGEYFFAYQNNKLYTETFHKNKKTGTITSTLKAYLLNQKRLIPTGSVRDTLEGEKSPTWYRLGEGYIESPGALYTALDSGLFVHAQKGTVPNTFRFSFFKTNQTVPYLSQEITLGQTLNRLFSFGMRKMMFTPEHLVIYSAYRSSPSESLKYLVSVCDREGVLLWEARAGYKLMDRPHPYSEIFWIFDNPLIHHNLVCANADNGKSRWEVSLYEQYNNDPQFEYSTVDPDVFKVLDIRSVMNGNYVAAVVGKKEEGINRHSNVMLYLLDRLGKVAYQYEVPGNSSYIKVKDLGHTIGLVSEGSSFRFRPK